MIRVKTNPRQIKAWEVYFRRDGEKRSVLVNSRQEARQERDRIVASRRKFLGLREVTLVEV